jgi:hypothetical protein
LAQSRGVLRPLPGQNSAETNSGVAETQLRAKVSEGAVGGQNYAP